MDFDDLLQFNARRAPETTLCSPLRHQNSSPNEFGSIFGCNNPIRSNLSCCESQEAALMNFPIKFPYDSKITFFYKKVIFFRKVNPSNPGRRAGRGGDRRVGCVILCFKLSLGFKGREETRSSFAYLSCSNIIAIVV